MIEALAFLTPEQVARLVRDYELLNANMSATSRRCSELLEEARTARAQADAVNRELVVMVNRALDAEAKLSVVARELQRARAGILLPGWFCEACRLFNGAAKEWLTECRGCGAARKVA